MKVPESKDPQVKDRFGGEKSREFRGYFRGRTTWWSHRDLIEQ